MACYIISYDQHRDKDYTPIWTALRSWGAQRVLESLWLLENAAGPGEIREALRTQTKDEDSLVIIELNQGATWSAYKAQPAGVNWLGENIRQY